ncbi:hypothetical protein [Blautia sp. MSJ-19]|uniref:hypothetical protein n=1 Tax=Blautia sp. MSJ-19 TaxID=2841517 RepID=UPI001C0EC44E|nr:hypothetical protein [Blautia sp. MSJ-19]MBU5480742.1 hypothetical protein [Blautia sp. MSJ-19]
MKRKVLHSIFAAGLLTAALFSTSYSASPVKAEEQQDAQTESISDTGDTAQLKTLLEDSGFAVQQGSFYELDTVKAASEGKLLSCFGNNAGSSYTVFDLPEASEQEVPNPTFPPAGWQYKLCQDEALVLVTTLPSECTYYSFVNYIMFTEQKEGKDYTNEAGFFSAGDETTGLYHPIFGSIGEPLNMLNIKHSDDSEFGTNAVIVISANQTITDQVTEQLHASGFDDSMINIMPIPAETYRMGLEKGDDTFCFLGRISQPADSDAYEKYVSTLADNSVLYRVTPKEEQAADPYENAAVTPRGTGKHETEVMDEPSKHLNSIREAIIAKYASDYTYEELKSDIAVPEGLTAYYNDMNSQGDNRDTTYLMTRDFTLDSDDDFVVVYGVNHTKNGKARYSNAVLYGRPMLNGVCSIYDSLYTGSASEYLEEDCENPDQYYVYKMARTQMDDHTSTIEYSAGNEKGKFYGVDNGNPLFLAFRAYLDETGVGASYYEIIYDRAIVFHKK